MHSKRLLPLGLALSLALLTVAVNTYPAILSILTAYGAAGVYYTSFHLEILPTLQKATLVAFLVWFLSLHYLTTKTDFAPRPTPS